MFWLLWAILGQLSFVFFPLWWKGNYSPLPQQLPQCFRDHSASFRDMHFTHNPFASFRDLVFLVFASATTVPLRFFRGFWLWLVFIRPFGLSLAFIFGFSFATFVCLGLGLCEGIRCLGMCSFRGASAKHRSKTGTVAKPTQRRIRVIWQEFISKSNSNDTGHGNWAASRYIQIHILSAAFYQHPLPQPSAKDILPRSFRGLPRPEPCAFFNEQLPSQTTPHKRKKKRNSIVFP